MSTKARNLCHVIKQSPAYEALRYAVAEDKDVEPFFQGVIEQIANGLNKVQKDIMLTPFRGWFTGPSRLKAEHPDAYDARKRDLAEHVSAFNRQARNQLPELCVYVYKKVFSDLPLTEALALLYTPKR